MAWTSPLTWVNGSVVTDSQLNTYLRDDTQYLKDVIDGNPSQPITLPNAVGYQAKDTSGAAHPLLLLDGNNKIIIQLANAAENLTILSADGTVQLWNINNVAGITSAGHSISFAGSYRSMRHGQANDRHVEGGSQASVASNGTATFTFAKAFSANPNVGCSLTNDAACEITALSTTAITLKNSSTGAQTVSFVAEGPSS